MTDNRQTSSDNMEGTMVKKTIKPPQPPSRPKSESAVTSVPEGKDQAVNANDNKTDTIDKKDPTRYGDWVKNGRCIDF